MAIVMFSLNSFLNHLVYLMISEYLRQELQLSGYMRFLGEEQQFLQYLMKLNFH